MSSELRRAVTALVGTKSGDRFFAELLFDMVRVPDLTCKSMGVGIRGLDTVLVYNPNLLIRWGDEATIKVLKHELLHIICQHIPRIMRAGNHQIGNVAADLVVNQMIADFPRKLDFYVDGEFKEGETISLDNMRKQFPELLSDMHFEYYYEHIMEKADKLDGSCGETADDHGQMSDGSYSPGTAERIWKEKVRGAMDRATRAGDAPKGAIRDVLYEFLDSSVDWKTALRSFPQEAERVNTSRTRKKRNRRYGLMYPGVKVERKCKLAVGFDLSGSITDEIKDKFSKELAEIAPYAELIILFFDSTVTAEKEFEEAEFNWKVPGGGSTCFAPVFDRAAELEVDGLIMLTDGENFDTIEEPSFPVLWGILENYPFNKTFGQHVVVK